MNCIKLTNAMKTKNIVINKNYYNERAIMPPKNILAEEVIIGYLLLNQKTDQNIAKHICGNFFILQKYRIIYFYIAKRNKESKINNIISIITLLKKHQLLDRAGGIKSIVNAIEKSQALSVQWHDSKHIEYFTQILHQHYTKRLFAQYSHNILQLSYIRKLSIQQLYYKCIQYLNMLQKNSFHTIERNHTNNIHNFLRDINQLTIHKNNIKSGFKILDKIINGFKHGELIIVAGRPSMGKTSFAINIAHNIVVNLKLSAHIFSLEMSKQEILDKLLSISSDITLQEIQSKTINQHNWLAIEEACKKLTQAKLYIDDEGNASINYIKSRCKQYILQDTLVVIDYLQLIKFNNYSTENRSQEIGIITRELKLLAKHIKSPIIILSQLNRKIENRVNKQPMLSDLRESGCLSYSNLPKIQKHYGAQRIANLYCVKQLYIFNPVSQFQICNSSNQYTYICYTSPRNLVLQATHNHKVLTKKQWQKKDQIKQGDFHCSTLKEPLNLASVLERNLFRRIKLLSKTQVYDVMSHEHHNFIAQKQIVHNSIEQDADLILMLYKAEENLENKKLDIIIAKHRNGPVGAFQLLFHAEKCKFETINEPDLPLSNKYEL